MVLNLNPVSSASRPFPVHEQIASLVLSPHEQTAGCTRSATTFRDANLRLHRRSGRAAHVWISRASGRADRLPPHVESARWQELAVDHVA
jgi:hypothetical protein